ncbi:MAG: hypothetical protein ABJ308_02795 [Halieaceae bacterium]
MSAKLTLHYFALLLGLGMLQACSGGGSSSAPAVPDITEATEEPPPTRQVDRNFTYHDDTRAIIEEKCVTCHTEGDIAPFALDDYAKVKIYAAAAAFAIRSGSMPPWPPTPGYTHFADERGLSQKERYILLNWLEGGLEEGEPQPGPATASDLEDIPPGYNLKLKMPEAYTPFLQPDDHRCFAIEWPLDEFSFVTDVDVLPDVTEQVHHVIVSVAEPEDAHLYYGATGEDGRPGWYCLGAGGVTGAPLPRQVGGWVPGAGREPTPEGTGMGVKPGSVLVVQMHYNTLVAEPAADQSIILLATADSVERPARGFLLTDPRFLRDGGMPIPAGDPKVSHEASFPAFALAAIFGEEANIEATDPWVMHQGFTHMHNLGVKARTTLIRPDGSEQVILDIRDWDFNWQGTYNFANELLVQPSDTIKLECTWDNSQANQDFVNGVQLITKDVQWGDGTQDEMCLMSVLMTQPKAGYDYSYQPTLYIESPSYQQAFAPGDLVPLQLILNNFSLHDPGEHDHDNATLHQDGDHAMADDDHNTVYNGHYHVYLDSDDDDAEHLTAWDKDYYYQLPEELAPGLHELRVSLRAADHHPLGIEQRVDIEITDVEVADSADLVDVDAWLMQDAGEDSLAEHRPVPVDCPDNSWYNEDGALEVETGYCNYLSLAQPTLVDINAGDQLHIVLWHGDLAFEEPAAAHVAVSIDGKLLWEAEVEIPADAEIFDTRVDVPFAAPAGSTVEYHLHNHGFNSWTLLQLEVER